MFQLKVKKLKPW